MLILLTLRLWVAYQKGWATKEPHHAPAKSIRKTTGDPVEARRKTRRSEVIRRPVSWGMEYTSPLPGDINSFLTSSGIL